MYSVLGLDQSMRHTGWGHLYESAKSPTSGTFELPHWGNAEGAYALKWYRWLLNFCRERTVTHLFWENTLIKKKWGHQNTPEDLAGKALVLLPDMAAAELGIVGQMVGIGTWRARYLGTARAPPHIQAIKDDAQRRRWWKDQALRAAAARQWFVEDHNAAEALGVMDYGVCTIDRLYLSRTDPIFRRLESGQDRIRIAGE